MSQPLDMYQSLRIPFFFHSRETASSREIKEWIMEDMWDIKRVILSQGDAHAKVDIQSNLRLQILTSSPTRSTRPP
jgi:hypothetical protein